MAHILIADDDDLAAAVIGDALAAAGHPSRHVASAGAAWDRLHAQRPDLLLLDQDMPDMPGTDLLAKLRGSPLLYDLPVVIITAVRPGADRGLENEEAMRSGAQDLLRKPFEPAALVARIEAALVHGVSPFVPARTRRSGCGQDMSGLDPHRQRHQRHQRGPRRA